MRQLAKALSHFVAVHARQSDVEEHRFGLPLLRGLERARTVEREGNLVTPHLEQHRHALRGVLVIVDDQQAALRCRAAGVVPRECHTISPPQSISICRSTLESRAPRNMPSVLNSVTIRPARSTAMMPPLPP